MNRKYLFVSLILVFACLLIFSFSRVRLEPLNTTTTSSEYVTVIVSINSVKINAMLADTPSKQMLGLGNRNTLGENDGMLFPYPQKIKPFYWMKNMLIPIDIIWISDNNIVGIEKSVNPPGIGTPDTELTRYSPTEPVNYVLEVNSGFSDKHLIKVGDEVKM